MIDTIKKNLIWFLCAALGVLQFILLAIPYFAAFAEGYGQSMSEGFSGYKVMDLWDGGFGGVMSSITQILILILGIVLLAIGAIGLLKAFDVVDLTDKLGKLNLKDLAKKGIFAYGGLQVLLFIFMIIFTASNTETESFMGVTVSAGVRFSAGLFITIVIVGAAIAAMILVPKKFPVDEDAPSVTYVCGQCGKKSKASNKFCNVCGGAIVEKVAEPKPVYVCSGCGKAAKASEKFCSACGSAIEAKVPETTVNE